MSVRVFFISLDHGLSALLWYDDAYQLTNRSCPIKRQKINPGSFEHLPNHTGKCAVMHEKIKQAPAHKKKSHRQRMQFIASYGYPSGYWQPKHGSSYP